MDTKDNKVNEENNKVCEEKTYICHQKYTAVNGEVHIYERKIKYKPKGIRRGRKCSPKRTLQKDVEKLFNIDSKLIISIQEMVTKLLKDNTDISDNDNMIPLSEL